MPAACQGFRNNPILIIIRNQWRPWEQQKQHQKVGCFILLHNCCGMEQCHLLHQHHAAISLQRAHSFNSGPSRNQWGNPQYICVANSTTSKKIRWWRCRTYPTPRKGARSFARAHTLVLVSSSSYDWTITTVAKPRVPPRLLCDRTFSRVINMLCFHWMKTIVC